MIHGPSNVKYLKLTQKLHLNLKRLHFLVTDCMSDFSKCVASGDVYKISHHPVTYFKSPQ